jgi:protein O-GlcNAc transferase
MFGWLKKSEKSAGEEPRELAQLFRDHLAGELALAAKGYAKSYGQDPKAATAGFLLVTTRIQLGNLAGVRDLLGEIAGYDGFLGKTAASLASFSGERLPEAGALFLGVGDLLKQYAMPEEATFYYRLAAELDPRPAEAWYRLGDLLHDSRLYKEARRALSAALEADPGHWGAGYTFAVLLQDVGLDAEAIPYYLHALELREDHAKTHNNLGSALLNTGDLLDAHEHFDRAVELDPHFAHARANLGTVLNLRGHYHEALAALEQAGALGAPAGCRVKHALIQPAVPARLKEITDARSRMQRELQALKAEGVTLADPLREVGITPFYLAYQGADDLPLMRQLADFYTACAPQLSVVAPHCSSVLPRPEGSKLRVGFASTFLYDHTIGRYFNQVIGKLNREQFHVTAISTFANLDPVAELILAEADSVITLPMNLDAAQQMISEARLDVLVYCDIGMEPLTYFLAFARLAPVQIAFYGHPESTGIPTIDFYLSHEECEPEGSAGHYSEKLLLLSPKVAYTFYPRPQADPEPKSRSDFALDPARHLYLCPQSLFKIHPDMDGLFARILAADPQGELLLFEGQQPHWNDLISERLSLAIPDFDQRVRFLPRMGHLDFLEVLRLSDVILDPLHFSGGATTLDGLAMGTPVVTLPGAFMRGRQTLACYRLLGMDECVVGDLDQYVEKAVEIASNPELRSELSRRILEAAPRLYEDTGMVREFEALLLECCPTR